MPSKRPSMNGCIESAEIELSRHRPAGLGQRANSLRRAAHRSCGIAALHRFVPAYADFHEQCVERMFMDIQRMCKPVKLAIYARYTRRGGLDINPFRASFDAPLPDNVRTARQ